MRTPGQFQGLPGSSGSVPEPPRAYPSAASKAPPVLHWDCSRNPPEAMSSFPFIVCLIKMSILDWKAVESVQVPLEWLPVTPGSCRGPLDGLDGFPITNAHLHVDLVRNVGHEDSRGISGPPGKLWECRGGLLIAYPSPASKVPPVPPQHCPGNPPEALGSFPFLVCLMKMSVLDWEAAESARGLLEWLPVTPGGLCSASGGN